MINKTIPMLRDQIPIFNFMNYLKLVRYQNLIMIALMQLFIRYGLLVPLGVDTSLNVIKNALDDIRDTSSSFKRAFVVETMGADCGYLALISALTSGAEICIIPEIKYDLDSLAKKLNQEIKDGRSYILAIVAEGTKDTNKIKQWIKTDLNLDVRDMILGHIQRGGSPSVYDRLMAFEFISYSIDRLIKDSVNEIIVYKDSKFIFITIDRVIKDIYKIDEKLLQLVKKLTI